MEALRQPADKKVQSLLLDRLRAIQDFRQPLHFGFSRRDQVYGVALCETIDLFSGAPHFTAESFHRFGLQAMFRSQLTLRQPCCGADAEAAIVLHDLLQVMGFAGAFEPLQVLPPRFDRELGF